MNRAFSLHTKVVLVAIGILILLFTLAYYYFSVIPSQESAESQRETKERYIGQLVELTLRKHFALHDLETFRAELTAFLADEDVALLNVEIQGQTIRVSRYSPGNFPRVYEERKRELLISPPSVTATLTIGFWINPDFSGSSRIRILNWIIIVDLIVLSALVFHLLVKEIVTQPLWQFVEATRQVAQGKFDQKLALSGGSKEELMLAESFNEMVHKLARSQDELRDANLFLEERVMERTHQIRESHAFREAVFATVQEGIYAVDSSKRITTFNPAAESITGLKAADVMGKPCSEIMNFPFCKKDCILERLHKVVPAPGASEELLDEMQKKGRSWLITGGLFDHLATQSGDRFPGGVETIKDLTNTMRLQQQLRQFEKLSSMGTLTAGVAHELNNPLSNIKIYAQLLAENVGDSTQVESQVDRTSIRNIVEQADRASTIVRKMLEFSGGQQMIFEPLSIVEVIHKSLDMVRFMVEKSQIEITVHIAEDLSMVVGSRMGLQQVLINLFTNAYQAMGEAGGRLEVHACHDQNRSRVLVRVTDSGEGIAPEFADRIFDPFFTTKDIGSGTGLGLSISYGIIKDHGGELSVSSEKGKGATFLVSLPIHPPSAEEGIVKTST